MRIAMISTEAGSGGAARAMQRLARGLRARGHTVDVFVAEEAALAAGEPASAHEIRVRRTQIRDAHDRFAASGRHLFDDRYVAPRRTPVSNTSFSTQVCGLDLARLPDLTSYDAVNVHWTGGMMSPLTLGNVIDLGIPTLFTLHDMGHFTGGCHYAAGCRAFEAACDPCGQVDPDELGLVPRSLALKRVRYGRPNVVAVSPSAWLAGLADASRVFASPVRVVPNGLDTDVFHPRDREAVRRDLGLGPEDRALLFGVYDRVERRKGFDDLAAALALSLNDPAVAALAAAGRIRVLTFGRSSAALEGIAFPVVDLGWVGDDARLSAVYGAADFCVVPSHEDNQPNVMVEAMACGTPVVAFRAGGIPETVVEGRNGRLVEPFDRQGLADAIAALLLDPGAARTLGRAAAETGAALTLSRQAEAYEAIVAELAAATGWRPAQAPVPAAGPGEARTAAAPLLLDPFLTASPVGPVLAAQIDGLAALVDELAADREGIRAELSAVKEHRDGLHAQLVAANERSAARDAELAVLKGRPLNRLILKLRGHLLSRLAGR